MNEKKKIEFSRSGVLKTINNFSFSFRYLFRSIVCYFVCYSSLFHCSPYTLVLFGRVLSAMATWRKVWMNGKEYSKIRIHFCCSMHNTLYTHCPLPMPYRSYMQINNFPSNGIICCNSRESIHETFAREANYFGFSLNEIHNLI